MEEGIIYWVGFIAFVIIMLMLDLGVFHKKDTAVSVKEAVGWSIFWISLALLFNLGIYLWMDTNKSVEFLTAYLLEKSLSVDNLFVFIMIFGYFNIAPKYQHKILFWGILGALVMRAAFIFAGVALIQQFSWVMYLFGAFLIYSGIHLLFEKHGEDKDFNPNNNVVIRLFRKVMPIIDHNEHAHFFVKQGGKRFATTFFLALLFIEVSDVIFAVDSIPAVLSVSTDTFIVFSSNIFAILGLRSLYFALSGIMKYFSYLSFALCGILSFIGIKMCVNELSGDLGYHFHISNFASLAVIVVLLTIAILLSVWEKKRKEIK
ncbi:MAG: TerC family protein [Bacteroidales bacterium]|jgi:tellurite resistance protein TerC|nr:TerC family protein [Bacteroidales bacterium]